MSEAATGGILAVFKISQYSQAKQLLLKRGSNTSISCEYCEIFKNTSFEKHLWTAAFKMSRVISRLQKCFVDGGCTPQAACMDKGVSILHYLEYDMILLSMIFFF